MCLSEIRMIKGHWEMILLLANLNCFQILKNRYGMRRVESDQIEMVFQASTYTHTLIDYAQVK